MIEIKEEPIKGDGTPERIHEGSCPDCGKEGKLASSQVFNKAVCYACLLLLAKGTGWL